MSKIVHRLQSVLDYAATKDGEWAAAAESKRKKDTDEAEEKERRDRDSVARHVDTLLTYLAENMEEWQPCGSYSDHLGGRPLARRVILVNLPDNGAFALAWISKTRKTMDGIRTIRTIRAIINAVHDAEPLLIIDNWASGHIDCIMHRPAEKSTADAASPQ